MNKQEAIDELMSKSREIIFGDDENVYLSRKRTIELVSQIHEPEKVVVPKFVAEWIEECKNKKCILYFAMAPNKIPKAVNEWLTYDGNDDIFARAWLDGYEVEQERLYVVTDGNKLYLKEFDELNAIIIIDDVVGATDYAKRYSDKSEAQKAADELGWFVKEVE